MTEHVEAPSLYDLSDEGRARRSFRAEVARDVHTIRTYVQGDVPLYTVHAAGDCFDLRQARALPAPPYGTEARFCFDPATGAPTRREIHRPEGTDVQQAVEVRTEVSADDFRLPAAGG